MSAMARRAVLPPALLFAALLPAAIRPAQGAAAPAAPQTLTLTVTDTAGLPPIRPDACPLIPGDVGAAPPLVHVRAALKAGGRLDVLAVGSGTVLGPEATHPEASFPYRMAQAIRAAAPQTTVVLTLRGGRGLTAEEMLSLLDSALAEHAYQLVLWQTGTVEAVHGLPVEALSRALGSGAERVRTAGADLVLIDPQFSRFLRANANLRPYEAALTQAAGLPGVTLFHRFDLMHAWVDQGGVDLERAERDQREKTADELHLCLGRALARMVLQGAGQ